MNKNDVEGRLCASDARDGFFNGHHESLTYYSFAAPGLFAEAVLINSRSQTINARDRAHE